MARQHLLRRIINFLISVQIVLSIMLMIAVHLDQTGVSQPHQESLASGNAPMKLSTATVSSTSPNALTAASMPLKPVRQIARQ